MAHHKCHQLPVVSHHTDVQLIVGDPLATLFAGGGPPVVHQWQSVANSTLRLPPACPWWSTSGFCASHSHWSATGVMLSGIVSACFDTSKPWECVTYISCNERCVYLCIISIKVMLKTKSCYYGTERRSIHNKKNGPSTEPCGTLHNNNCRVDSTGQVGSNPLQHHIINAKPLSQSTEQEVMINRVKSRRQIQERKSSKFTTVLSWQYIILNIQKGPFRWNFHFYKLIESYSKYLNFTFEILFG